MNSREKNARIVCRMKSVEVTRVMPSRCAVSVASVDFPVPVAPPTSRKTGSSSCCSACRRRRRLIVAPGLGLAEHLRRELRQPVEIELDLAALDHVGVGAACELVRPRRRQTRRGERARHQALSTTAAPRRRRAAAVPDSGARSHAHHRARDRLGREPLELGVEIGLAGERHDVVPGQNDLDPAPLAPPRRRRRSPLP